MPPTQILLSAGEASGDMYAARLAAELQKHADVNLFGMGGAEMRAAGVEVITDYSEVNVLGITEILSHLPQLRRAMRNLVSWARERKPALAILTDFPGFHLRLSRKLKPLGVKNVYYICPQFWAWRPWRANLVRRRFELALCIFPFEEKFFGDAGVPVKFIGHPLVGEVRASLSRGQFEKKHGLDPSRRTVAILPGSRWGEIERHLPTLLESVRELERQTQGACNFVLAISGGTDIARVKALIPEELRLIIVQDETYDALAAADAAMICSGTATVEAALLDVPMIVVYRVSKLTALLAKPLIRTKYFGMVNLIAEREVAPELIQDDFQPRKIAEEIRKLFEPGRAAQARADLAEVRRRLGPPGAVQRAAEAILELIPQADRLGAKASGNAS
ncbi:MAG: lipid-A-disaccharide synthase [Acidobacteria bacterium]|nr:lipid-A-disaccharide synthase [Acidobacteriota bacterium]MBS1866933.1 lipid-A-disaccharide synthase [Acidobacteriota bacterium]